MRPLYTFTVKPSLPPELESFRKIAGNLLWSWDHELLALIRRLDPDLWEDTLHNPVAMLGRMRQERFAELVADDSFVSEFRQGVQRLDDYLKRSTWFDKQYKSPCAGPLVAYFSMEFGITESFQIYAGGLGVLAGDHLKSASDLGVPLVGVGLLYQKGYFRQYLNADGWQQERSPENDFYNLPLVLERDPQGSPIIVKVAYPGREVLAQVWRADVGRVKLYLLDTNIPANSQEDQDITDNLYGGGADEQEMRAKQTVMLGIGGVRALRLLGLNPMVYHMNEGHSAFLAIERIRELIRDHGLTFDQAREIARAGAVFTTHTSMPAGIWRLTSDQIGRYFGMYYGELGLDHERFMGLGRQNPQDPYEPFCMPILALRLSAYSNAVSKLHGEVSRRMWQGVWPGIPPEEVPIDSVTNGIHQQSWISSDMAGLFERYLGPRWRETPADAELWSRVERIPGAELWNTHQRRRERLVAFVRQRLREQLKQRGAPQAEQLMAEEVLDPEALTIGFGRRFATYKRATLLLRDPDRLIRILGNVDRPLQVIYAGKAHPKDDPGKDLIRQIVHLARREEIRLKLVFLEDYDMNVARYMVQGVDVWLNTPIPATEASGTSGMKAAANGALNVSIIDGWWKEAYTPEIGWAIGRGEDYGDRNLQDHVESNALYDLLEQEIAPLFYLRGSDGLPRQWIQKMKASMEAACPIFNTHRMLQQYTEKYYIPACERHTRLSSDGMAPAKALADWKARVRAAWPRLRIEQVGSDIPTETQVGLSNNVWARIYLGELTPQDIDVELYYGAVDASGQILNAEIAEMESGPDPRGPQAGPAASGVYTFVRHLTCESSGMFGFTVRVVPRHAEQVNPVETGLILWG